MIFYISLIILSFTLGASIFNRRFFNNANKIKQQKTFRKIYILIFIFSAIIIFGFVFFQSYFQFQVWSNNEISKHLIPPFQPINYFLFYIGVRFFSPYLISLISALLFLFLIKFLNKKFEEKFFYNDEYYFGAISIFLLGYPGFLFYFIFLAVFSLIFHIFNKLFRGKNKRISLYYLWLSTAIFVIILNEFYISQIVFWPLLKI